MEMIKIEKETIVFNGKLIVEKGDISYQHKKFSRLRVKREDAAAVLILNVDSNKIILVQQFRYAVASKITEQILEIPAGKVDKDETPLTTALRETEEETGYRIKPTHIKFLISCFPSPGYSSERFFLYYATVTNEDKVSKGGGLKNENEFIETVEVDVNQFTHHIKNGDIKDAKTYLAALYMMI
jgi:nudix-type nucleoside diphosphatase (YffH/AdpP family)